VTLHRAKDASHGRSWFGQSDHASDEGGGRRVGAAEEGERLDHRVQEELKSRKAVKVKVKVWQRERVLQLRYGIRRDRYQFERMEQGRTLCVLVPLLPCPNL